MKLIKHESFLIYTFYYEKMVNILQKVPTANVPAILQMENNKTYEYNSYKRAEC